MGLVGVWLIGLPLVAVAFMVFPPFGFGLLLMMVVGTFVCLSEKE